VRTGNPVFPYLNNVFHSPLFDSSQPLRDLRYPAYLRPDLLYQITFRSHRFVESLDGASGFHFFVLWPVALLALRRRLPYWVTVAAAAPLMLLVVLAGWLLAEGRRYGPWLGRMVAGAAVLCVLGNTWMLGAASGYNEEFALNLVFDRTSRERFLSSAAPTRTPGTRRISSGCCRARDPAENCWRSSTGWGFATWWPAFQETISRFITRRCARS
jgi:hypothetical protein